MSISSLPEALETADGKRREVTAHLQFQALRRQEITVERIVSVLDNWVIRGIKTDANGRQSTAYWGWVLFEGAERLMLVSVSIDDRRLTTAHLDSRATRKLATGDMQFFQSNYADIEVQYEPDH